MKIILLIITIIMPDGSSRVEVNKGSEGATYKDCVNRVAPVTENYYRNLVKNALDVNVRCVTITRPAKNKPLEEEALL
jgi:hypothetical protein